MRAFPAILVVVVLYNLLVFGSGLTGHHDIQAVLGQGFSLNMFSGDVWRVTLGDLFVLLSLLTLFLETLKAARGNGRAILHHGLSTLVFCATLVEFIMLKGFSTSAFFFIALISLFDVVAGYTISIVATRADGPAPPPDEHA